MDASEKYFVKTVAEDLQYISMKWDDRIDDVSLRVVSPILRKLLVEDLYSKAWRLIGFERQPKVKAMDSDAFIFGVSEKVPIELIDFALAGGAQYQGSMVHGCVNKRVLTKDPKKAYEETKQLLENPK